MTSTYKQQHHLQTYKCNGCEEVIPNVRTLVQVDRAKTIESIIVQNAIQCRCGSCSIDDHGRVDRSGFTLVSSIRATYKWQPAPKRQYGIAAEADY